MSSKDSSNKWQSSGGDDFLQLVQPGGLVLGGIDATGAPYGALGNGAGGITPPAGDIGGTTSVPTVVSTHLSSPLPVSQGGTGSSNPTSGLVTSGLIAQYQMLATESAAALVDYSGNGNNATGTVGTAPTIIAGSGGVLFAGTGAIALPAALNSAKTIMLFGTFNANSGPGADQQAFVQGNDASFNAQGLELVRVTPADAWGPASNYGYRLRTLKKSNTWGNSSVACFNQTGIVTVLFDTADRFFINATETRYFFSGNATNGAQTAGNYQLGGCAAGAGQTAQSYLNGSIYYAVFYNRVLTATEIAQNQTAIVAALAARGVSLTTGPSSAPGVVPTDTFFGDSETASTNGPFENFINHYAPPMDGFDPSSNIPLVITNGGVGGKGIEAPNPQNTQETDSVYRPGAFNSFVYWLGTNSGLSALPLAGAAAAMIKGRKALGYKTALTTMMSRVGSDGTKNLLNTQQRATWASYSDILVDMGALPNLGSDGAYANLTYFDSSQVHCTALSCQYLQAPLFNRALSYLWGPKDFSAANTATFVGAPAATGVTLANGQFQSLTGGTGGTFFASVAVGNVSEGSLLIAVFDTTIPTTVTDSLGNTWTKISNLDTTGAGSVWYALNSRPGPLQLGVSSGGTSKFFSVALAEYKNCANLVFESSSLGSQTTGTSFSGGAVTPAENNCLVLGIFAGHGGSPSTITPGGSFTKRVSNVSGGFGDTAILDFTQSSAGSITPSLTTNTSCTGQILSLVFKPQTPGNYQVQDYDCTLKADPSGGSLTIMLPPATGLTGTKYKIKNLQVSGVNTITVVPFGRGITSVVANGSTAIFTVPDITPYIAGQTITVSGCTTSGLNTTYTITSVALTSGTAGTITVTSAQNVTENEPSTAQIICEYINGQTSFTLANGVMAEFESVLISSSTGGNNWITE